MSLSLKLVSLFILLLFIFAAWTATDTYKSTHNKYGILPMSFAHADHTKEQCVACHHNYQDGTGHGLCLTCHQTNKEVSFLIREQFHDLCMGCHQEKVNESEDSGPLRSCQSCHTADDKP